MFLSLLLSFLEHLMVSLVNEIICLSIFSVDCLKKNDKNNKLILIT